VKLGCIYQQLTRNALTETELDAAAGKRPILVSLVCTEFSDEDEMTGRAEAMLLRSNNRSIAA